MKNIILILIAVLATSCYKDKEINGQYSDEFYVRNDKVDMPVWVRGNIESDAIIIFIHGGPLLSGIEVAISDDFSELHKDYTFVYYDQRGGGFSHGNRNINLNEEQMVDDLDAIVDFVKFKYEDDKSIFLMGHSWGGYLGTKYLSDEIRQKKINGWIELAGAHNFELNWQASKTFVLNFAQEKINAGEDENGFWSTARNDLENLSEVKDYNDVLKINWRAQRIDGEVNSSTSQSSPSYFEWATSPSSIGIEQKDLQDLEQVVVKGNLNSMMNKIDLPSLLIYGGMDAIVPAQLGENALQFLGTSSSDLKLLVLQESGHEMWRIQKEEFIEEVTLFVETYQ